MKDRNLALIVDDSELNRSMLADILSDEYDIIEAENGLEAISQFEKHQFDISLVLLDIVMPEMDGFEVLAIMSKNKWIERVPVIIISAESSSSYIDNAYDLGATEFISRPFDPKTVQRRASNTVMLYSKQNMLENMVTEQMLDKEKSNLIMVELLSHIVELRNGESGMHVLNIRSITKMLLTQLCRTSDRYASIRSKISLIANASSLHDIGKISVPEHILNNPGSLSADEWVVMKAHSMAGANILESTRYYPDEELVRVARDICRWHHERYDGGGYPDALVGEQIPIEAQVVALADVYDALTHKRVYKEAISHEESMRMILYGECGAFNPLLLQCLVDIAPQLKSEMDMKSLGRITKEDMLDITRSMMQTGDVSNRTLALLEQERTKYQFFAHLSQEIQFEYNVKTDLLMLSEWGAEMLGLSSIVPNPLGHVRLHQIIMREDLLSLRDLILSATPDNPNVSSSYLLHVNNQKRWHKILARPLWLGNDEEALTGFIGKCVDVHEEQLKLDRLVRQASTDPLTGMFHREAARQAILPQLERHEHDEKRFALMLFDLDQFKTANDSYGHLFGDKILKQMALRVQRSVRESDVTARIGGDEFLVFIEYEDDPCAACKRVFESLASSSDEYPMTVSMGVALFPAHATCYDDLFHRADQALYAAKQLGRDRCCFYEDSMAGLLSVLSEICRQDQEPEPEPENLEGSRR